MSKDWNEYEFISTLEHAILPLYGIQFHPETNIYEWIEAKNIPHDDDAIKISQYFADFFIKDAEYGDLTHKFGRKKMCDWNFAPHYIIR